jgi:hypothetical protein
MFFINKILSFFKMKHTNKNTSEKILNEVFTINKNLDKIYSRLEIVLDRLDVIIVLLKRISLQHIKLNNPKINLEGEEMDKIKFSVVLPDWPVSDVVEANVNVSVYYNGELLKSDSYTVQPPQTVISGLEGPQDSLVRVNMSYVDDAGNVSNVVSFEQILFDVFAPEPPIPGIIKLEGEVWEHEDEHKEVEEHEPEAAEEEHKELAQEEHEEAGEAHTEVSEVVEEHHSDDIEPSEDHHDDVVQSVEEDHNVASESVSESQEVVGEEKHEVVEVTEEMVSEEHHEDVPSEEQHHDEVVEEHKDEHEEQHDVIVEINDLPFPEVEGNVKVVNDVDSEEGKDLADDVVEVEELPMSDVEVSEEGEK